MRTRSMEATRILEIIHLRFAGREVEDLSELVREVAGESRDVGVHVYRHTRMETDLLVHLHRDVPAGSVHPSDLGSHLALLLREHGLVEHSVWVEQPQRSA